MIPFPPVDIAALFDVESVSSFASPTFHNSIFIIYDIFLIFPFLLFNQQGSVDEFEIRMLIHQSLAGCVIGKAGSKIKELKDVSSQYLYKFVSKEIMSRIVLSIESH